MKVIRTGARPKINEWQFKRMFYDFDNYRRRILIFAMENGQTYAYSSKILWEISH